MIRIGDEELWARYAAGALQSFAAMPDSGGLTCDIRDACKYADAMLAEHRKRFPVESDVSDLDVEELRGLTAYLPRQRETVDRLDAIRRAAKR